MRRPQQWWIVAALGLGGVGIVAVLWYVQSASTVAPSDVNAFLERHWRRPVPLQGKPPRQFSPLEASLLPQDCGTCHPQQYQDWQSSLHSRSMSPGVYGQLLDMQSSDPATYTLCATCHAPLSEQIPHLLQGNTYRPNPAFEAHLQQAGLMCAACHVRQHQRFGPPPRPEAAPLAPGVVLPHGGFTASPAFQRAEFCRSCHQFGPDDFALNGKLLENTYVEWQQSPYAQAGVPCQQCHMPERRHLWRGIHDPDMVRQAMTVTITPAATVYHPGDTLQAVITVTNSGAGHYLPTYVTPKIFVEAELLDHQGQGIADSLQQSVIGREVALDLSQELYDTRIPPQASHSLTYTHLISLATVTLRVRVVVHPDHFYQRFFTATLQGNGDSKGRPYLEEALRATATSSYTVFERLLPLQ